MVENAELEGVEEEVAVEAAEEEAIPAEEIAADEAVPAEEPAEEVETEASPNEPDESPEEEDDMPEKDEKGIVTALSKDEFKKLRAVWLGNGSPHRITAFGTLWHVYDDGAKFVAAGPPGGMGDYGSLSTSRVNK